MQANIITFATPVFFLLIFIELFVSRRMKKDVYRLDDSINSIGLGILSQIVAVFTRVLALGVYAAAYNHFAITNLSDSSITVWILALIGYDFCYYWLHRFGHEFSVLWAAHVVHHQSEEYNLSTALRQTSTGALLGWVFYIPLAIAGVPPVVFAGVAMIDLLYQFWIHTQLIGKLGWFDHVFASPSNHRVHHAVNDKYLDKNYGGILILWDKIFGTFEAEDDKDPPVYGTRSQLKSWNPLWANLEIYSAMITNMSRTNSWRNRFKIIVSKTGWQPEDVDSKFPKVNFNSNRSKFIPNQEPATNLYSMVQFSIVLVAAVHFLQAQSHADTLTLAIYGLWILLSLISIGFVLESRRVGIYVEQIRWSVTGISIITFGQWFLTGRLDFFVLGTLAFLAFASLLWVSKIGTNNNLAEKPKTFVDKIDPTKKVA
jgi:alkylglycerol monooxygenase